MRILSLIKTKKLFIMKLFRVGLSVIIACISAFSLQAQSAGDIINKHVDAIGGKDVLNKVKSIYFEGTANAMGADYPTTTTILAGKGFKTVTTVNGSDIIQCFTDTSGWSLNPMSGQTTATSLPPEMVKKGKSALDIGGELVNFREKGFTDSLLGREDYGGVNAFKVKLSQPGIEIVYLFDPTTYYTLKTDTKVSVNGQDVTNTIKYSDFKKTDIGYVVPTTLMVNNAGYDVTITYTKVEVNKEVDPKIFEMPK
jgi:outer membrane lipoprotein-sorting protein